MGVREDEESPSGFARRFLGRLRRVYTARYACTRPSASLFRASPSLARALCLRGE